MKYVIISCDTEVGEIALESNVQNAFELFILGNINNRTVGYQLINDIASSYGAVVDHFVDIYPNERYGENKFESLVNNILKSGHQLHLHTHPSGFHPSGKRLMHQYSLDEQTEIIALGKKKIYDWTGLKVDAHRAGAYGADNNTLIALKRNDINFDSSFYYGHKNCKIAFSNINQPEYIKEVYQVPVTVYQQNKGIIKRINKLDFRYSSTPKEIIDVIRLSGGNAVITIFLHSCNFMKIPYHYREKKFGEIVIDNKLISDFEEILSTLSTFNDVKFISLKDINVEESYSNEVIEINSSKNYFKKGIQLLNKEFGIIYK